MMLRNALLSLAVTLVPAAPALAQSTPGPSPTVEVALGFNGPQYGTAQFPGLTASVALLYPIKPTFGIGVVGEADASYSRLSQTAGVRAYRRSKHVTVFAQVLAGVARPYDQGIILATGGNQIQPGVGMAVGSNRYAFLVEVDYRSVKGGSNTNTRTHEVTSMSGGRFLIGITIRLRRR